MAAMDEKQSTTESLLASPIFPDSSDQADVDNLGSASSVGAAAVVTSKAGIAAFVESVNKAATRIDDSATESSIAMSVVYVEKNSSDTAIPKTPGGAAASGTEVDEAWPALGDGAGVKGHLKRAASSAPGSARPGTGGTNPRRVQTTRSGISAPGSASPGSSVINSGTDGDAFSDWTTKRNGKNVSPNSGNNTATPLRLNKSGYPVITAALPTVHRGKNKALFGAMLQSSTSNSFNALSTDSSASMDH